MKHAIRWIGIHSLCALPVALGLTLRPLVLPAQGLVTVRGTVSNESGRPLEQAQVTLDPQGANRQVRTDRDGRFSFLGVPTGTHSALRDFSPEDVVAVEFYGAVWRQILSNPARALEGMDPSGSLRDRWPPRTPCGQPLTPGEGAASKSIVKVMFANVWLRK